MNLENFLVRPAREWVETYREWDNWHHLTPERAGEVARNLAGLPSTERGDDEDAKRFDLILLRLQLSQLDGDAVTFERLRKQVQDITSSLLGQTAIPSVKAQEQLLEQLAGDEWWGDVTLPLLELARRRVRTLVRFVEKTKRAIVYVDWDDPLGEATIVDLPGVGPGTNWERFRAKARAYLRDHDDHLALQRLHRNLPLTAGDLDAPEEMLVEAGAGTETDIARYLSDSSFSANQLRFIQLIVEHVTANGVMEIARLYESPFTDNAPQGPDMIFTDDQVNDIVAILHQVRANAARGDGGITAADQQSHYRVRFGLHTSVTRRRKATK